MNKKIFLLLGIFIPLMVAIPTMRIDVFVFHAEACGACAGINDFLEEASEKYPTMVVHKFDVSKDETLELYDLFKDVYGINMKEYPVPLVFIGHDYFIGYSATNLRLMEMKLDVCMKEGCTIALPPANDVIVIIDSTPTPKLPVSKFLIPFLVIAGVFCCITPYNAGVVPQLKSWKSALFFCAYFVTSLLLCFALMNVVFLAETVVFLRTPLVVLAVVLGALSLVSVKIKILKVPESFKNAMDKLIEDQGEFSISSLGIGACLISLMYTGGIYFLVVYRMLYLTLMERLLNFMLFNAVLLIVFTIFLVIKPEKKTIFYILVGAGSVALGIFYYFVW